MRSSYLACVLLSAVCWHWTALAGSPVPIQCRGCGLSPAELGNLSMYMHTLMSKALESVDCEIRGSMSKVGDRCLICFFARDAELDALVAATRMEVHCRDDNLISGTEQAAASLSKSLQARPPSLPRLSVQPIESRGSGLDADALSGLTDYWMAGVIESGKVWVVDPGKEKGSKRRAGRAKAAKPAEHTLRVIITKVGDNCLLSFLASNAERDTLVAALGEKSTCASDYLIDRIDRAAIALGRSLQARSASAPRVVVQPIESRGSGLDADALSGLTDYLIAHLVASGAVFVANPVQRRRSKSRPAVEHTIRVTVARVGPRCILTSAVFDQRGNMVKGTSQRAKCDPDGLIYAAEKTARDLARVLGAAGP
ncbi:MAG: hypothetical protein JXR96_24010 [Deltaproteobacteria bacterium]|nr:hypothetical protein [Deltaproteobacteria bacterium]